MCAATLPHAHPATPRRRRTLLAPDILDVVEDAEAAATAPAHTMTAAQLRAAGGGWTVGSIASFDAVARELAAASRALVVSVGYRLAPEHPFPVPVDEAVAAIRWLAANAHALGEAYGAALRAASVRATIRRYPGIVHGFWRWLARSRAAGRAVGEVGAALHAALT